MSESSFMTRRARLTTTSPSSVRRPEARSTSCTSSSRSRRATWADTLDCTVPIVVAAAEKLPVSAMPRSACKCFNSMTAFLPGDTPGALAVLAPVSLLIRISDDNYLAELLDRLGWPGHNGSRPQGMEPPLQHLVSLK